MTLRLRSSKLLLLLLAFFCCLSGFGFLAHGQHKSVQNAIEKRQTGRLRERLRERDREGEGESETCEQSVSQSLRHARSQSVNGSGRHGLCVLQQVENVHCTPRNKITFH